MTPHDAALDYAERDWRVMPVHYPKDDGRCSCRRPCSSVGKHPRPKKWQELATTDVDTVDRWWKRDPSNNVGIATGGAARLVVLDIDPKDGGYEALDGLLATYGSLPPTPTVETGSGGRHYYMRAPDGVDLRNSAGKLGPGLDIRADGGQVVAPPSMHVSGKRYRWRVSPQDEDIAEIPAWLVDLLLKQSKRTEAPAPNVNNEVATGKRNDFLTRRAGQLRRLALDQGTIESVLLKENAEKCQPPLPVDEVKTIARSVARYSPVRLPESPTDWRNKLREKVDKKGQPTGEYMATRANVCVALANDKKWRGRIWLDETRSQIKLGDKALQESDLTKMANDLDRRYGWHSLALTTVHEAVGDVAARNKVDVLRDYLEGLKWDGQERLSRWLYDAIGTEWNALICAYARKFMIQAVARAMRPGCKADAMLVLVGDQGTGKSTLVRALAGDDWFSDTPIDMRSQDRFATVNGVWIYEFAELASLRGARGESTKAFISSQEDRWRKPYARTETVHKRRVVFVGTTNEETFLSDPTGSRRFWPVRVEGPLNLSWLRSVRDQLWAEAVVAFKAGEGWHLDKDEAGWRAAEAEQYQEADPWEPAIAAWAKSQLDPFTTGDVLREALKVDSARWSQDATLRVETILRANEFFVGMGKTTQQGARITARVWRQPASVRPIQGDLVEGMPESPEDLFVPEPAPAGSSS